MSITLSFDLRANTASGSTSNITTVNVKWYAGSRVTDLGNFYSYAANVTADAPWSTVTIDVSSVYDTSDVNRLEITRVSGDNAHVKNVLVDTTVDPAYLTLVNDWTPTSAYGGAATVATSTALFRSSPDARRLYQPSAGWGALQTQLVVTGVVPGKTYRFGVWVRDLTDQSYPGGPRHITWQAQNLSTGAQLGLVQSDDQVNIYGWTLISSTFTATATGTSYRLILDSVRANGVFGGGAGPHETFIDDWFVHELTPDEVVPDPAALTLLQRDYGAFPLGFPYTADVEDGMLGVPASSATPPWTWIAQPTAGGGSSQVISFQASSYSGSYYAMYCNYVWRTPDGNTGSVDAGVPYPGSPSAVQSLTMSYIPAGATLVWARVTFYPTSSSGSLILTWMAQDAPILNDRGTLPDAAYYAEHGDTVDPSPYNYPHLNPSSPGTSVNGTDGWSCDPAWYYDSGGSPVLESHSSGSSGSFNALGYSLCTRSDGLRSAPFHHIECDLSYYGSRGSNGQAAVWGYNGPNDYWFAMPNSNHGPGYIARVSGGVETHIAAFNVDSWVNVTVNHDFVTGLLTIDTYEPFLGNVTHFSGTYPWSVVNGRVGWLGRTPNGGIFWDSALVVGFKLIYSLGLLGYKRQYSMQDLAVVPSDPLTWYFFSANTVGWTVGAIGIG